MVTGSKTNKHRNRPIRCSNIGFTFIELLVLIANIIILASLFLQRWERPVVSSKTTTAIFNSSSEWYNFKEELRPQTSTKVELR